MRARRRLRERDRPAARARQARQRPLGHLPDHFHVDDLRPPRARGRRAVQARLAAAAFRRRPRFLPLIRIRIPGQAFPLVPGLPAPLAVLAPLPLRFLPPPARPCAAPSPRCSPSTAASRSRCCPGPAGVPAPQPAAPAAGTAPAQHPARPAAPRSPRPSPRSRPAAGPAAHAAPRHQQTDQAHRTRTPIMLNLNYRFKHPARRVTPTSPSPREWTPFYLMLYCGYRRKGQSVTASSFAQSSYGDCYDKGDENKIYAHLNAY